MTRIVFKRTANVRLIICNSKYNNEMSSGSNFKIRICVYLYTHIFTYYLFTCSDGDGCFVETLHTFFATHVFSITKCLKPIRN